MNNLDFSNQKVAIIGDVMLDRYMVGQSTRKSPEADVPVLENYTIDNRLGGAANVALNILHLGAKPFLFGVIGNDDSGSVFKEVLEANDINSQYLITESDRKTTLKTRVMKGSEHLLRVDQEDKHLISTSSEEKLFEALVNTANKEGIQKVILQDYNKGVLTPSLIKRIINFCKQSNIFVAVDPKFEHISMYKEVDLFKPNLKEVQSILNTNLDIPKDLKSMDNGIRAQLSPKYCVVTLGAKGISLSNDKEEQVFVEAEPLVTVDVCGAGDGVISFLTLAIEENVDLRELGKLSNWVGRIICSNPGVSTIKLKDLKKTP